jgi:hypothetical protein
VAYRAHHERQPDRVTDEARDADHHSADQDDKSIEQLVRRHLPLFEARSDVTEHGKPHTSNDDRAECARKDQDRKRPQKSKLSGDRHERRDLSSYEHEHPEEQHNEGYLLTWIGPVDCERASGLLVSRPTPCNLTHDH